MTAIISKWGNSQGLRFPKNIMKELELSVGDEVRITTEKHKVIIEPLRKKRKKYNISDLVGKIPDGYRPYEVFNDETGAEEW